MELARSRFRCGVWGAGGERCTLIPRQQTLRRKQSPASSSGHRNTSQPSMKRTHELLSRRAFVTALATLGAGIAACGESPVAPTNEPARLRVTPTRPTRTPRLGLQPIVLLPALPALQRDGVLHVPQTYNASEPLPLIVLLPGATGSGNAWFGSYGPRAEAARMIILAGKCTRSHHCLTFVPRPHVLSSREN